jgi:hypothetical protein
MVKLRRRLSLKVTISDQAIARWREIRPSGAHVQGNCAILCDDALADALGIPTLLWLWEAAEAKDALEASMENEPAPD